MIMGISFAQNTHIILKRRLGFSLFMYLIIVINTSITYAQDSTSVPRPKGKWLRERGPFDPRPYECTVFKSPLINANYFNTKNKLWVENGFSFGGYASANVQWGSKGGPAHGICESLNNGAWEPLRKTNTAGHGYLVHKKRF